MKTRVVAGFLRGLERIGGFGGKSDVLARGQVFAGNPEAYREELAILQRATPEQVKAVANRWLSDGVFALEVHPFPDYKPGATVSDRSKMPETGAPPELRLPKLQRATLSNNLKVILAERHELPLLRFTLAVDAGYASDFISAPGVASLAMNMLDEGTRTRTSLQISEQLEAVGAQLSTFSNLDLSFVSLSALKTRLDPALEIFADVILNPSFPEADFRREQKLKLAAIQREKVQPTSMGLRVMPALLYGKQHPYGNPLTGSGTEDSVSSFTREMLVKFHQSWFKPDNATLIVVGDTTLPELTGRLERLFQSWKPGAVPDKQKALARAEPARPAVYVMDKPGSIQSVVLAGHVAPPKANPDEIAIETLNTLLGGMFISRINMNLREDKHWSYGAGTVLWDARGQRPFFAYAPVQSDKTKETMVELKQELQAVVGDRPATPEELETAQNNLTLSLPGSRETTGQVAGSIVNLVQFGLPDDYYETYSGKVRKLTTRDLSDAAGKLVRPVDLVWVVVGDRSKIEAGIRDLGYGELRFIDADGKVLP